MTRVVITGFGTYNPLAHTADETWQKIKAGESGLTAVTLFDASDQKSQVAGEVKAFDPVGLFGRKDARRMARITQLGLASATQAIQHAQLPITPHTHERIGVTMGTGMGTMEPLVTETRTLDSRGPSRVSPFFVPMMLPDTPSAMISITHGLRGPNHMYVSACAAANNAIGEAAHMIKRGAADVMLAGGTESCIIPLAFAGFGSMGALSTQYNDTPQTASRPFDQTRDGFVCAEGAAVLVLESLEHAQQRGATIYGEFLGYGTSSDAYHISMPAQNGEGAMRSMREALRDAGLTTADVDYINAHGTSTPLNDKEESAAIQTLFGPSAPPVSSTKSLHGHMLGATGALEAILACYAMQEGIIPATMNYVTPDPNCTLDYVPNTPRHAELNVVLSNAFGLGGHNASLIVGKFKA